MSGNPGSRKSASRSNSSTSSSSNSLTVPSTIENENKNPLEELNVALANEFTKLQIDASLNNTKLSKKASKSALVNQQSIIRRESRRDSVSFVTSDGAQLSRKSSARDVLKSQSENKVGVEFNEIIGRLKDPNVSSIERVEDLKKLMDVNFLSQINKESPNVDVVEIAKKAHGVYQQIFNSTLTYLINEVQKNIDIFNGCETKKTNTGTQSILPKLQVMLNAIHLSKGEFVDSKEYIDFTEFLAKDVVYNIAKPVYPSDYVVEQLKVSFPELLDNNHSEQYHNSNILIFESNNNGKDNTLKEDNIALLLQASTFVKAFKPLISLIDFKEGICSDLKSIIELNKSPNNSYSIAKLLSIVKTRIDEHLQNNIHQDEHLSNISKHLHSLENKEITTPGISHLENLANELKPLNPSANKPKTT